MIPYTGKVLVFSYALLSFLYFSSMMLSHQARGIVFTLVDAAIASGPGHR